MSDGTPTATNRSRSQHESTVVAEFIPGLPKQLRTSPRLTSSGVHQDPAVAGVRVPADQDRGRARRNLRTQLEALNGIEFSDAEWEQFFTERIAGANEGIVEKTVRIQEDYVQLLKRDDGTTKNIRLIDKTNIHNNRCR